MYVWFLRFSLRKQEKKKETMTSSPKKEKEKDEGKPERVEDEVIIEKEKLEALEREIRKSRTKEKLELRRTNANYIAKHPEIGSLLRQFLTLVYKEKPDDVMELAVRFFCQVDLKGCTLKRDQPHIYMEGVSAGKGEE